MSENKVIPEKKSAILVRANNSFCFSDVKGLKEKLKSLIEEGRKYIIFDLSNVKWMDAFGVSVIAWSLRQAILLEGKVVVIVNNPKIMNTLTEVKLTELLCVERSVEEAISNLKIQ